jgi:hypothetical protein
LQGATVQAVLRAITRGRLNKSLVRDDAGKAIGINDVDLADAEWAGNTDLTKAPAAVVVKAMAAAGSSSSPSSSESSDDAPVDPNIVGSFQDALAKEKHYKALEAELNYKKRVGELVEAKDVEARIVDEYARVRTKLLGVARKAKAQLPHLTREDVTTIDNLVREALEDLATSADEQAAS